MKTTSDLFLTLKKNFKSLLLIGALLLPACTTMKVNVSQNKAISGAAPIIVGPLANFSDTPLANRQLESMVTGILRAKGFHRIRIYQRTSSCTKLLYCPDENIPLEKTLHWARSQGAEYVLIGSANEWRYKVGLDGEPVAGVTLILVDAYSGKTIWSGVGSAVGYSRAGLDLVGQELLNSLLGHLKAVW